VPNFVEIAHTMAEICQFSIFKMAAAAILNFGNYKFLKIETVVNVELRHSVKCR